MDSQQATTALHVLWQTYKDLPYKQRSAEIGWRHEEIETKWREYLFEQHDDLPKVILHILFAKAWEDGHASGYYEVESTLEDLCAMQRKIFSALKIKDLLDRGEF